MSMHTIFYPSYPKPYLACNISVNSDVELSHIKRNQVVKVKLRCQCASVLYVTFVLLLIFSFPLTNLHVTSTKTPLKYNLMNKFFVLTIYTLSNCYITLSYSILINHK